ncbi:MAG: hypothetical protein AAF310_03660 [Myxococcota bacterium]
MADAVFDGVKIDENKNCVQRNKQHADNAQNQADHARKNAPRLWYNMLRQHFEHCGQLLLLQQLHQVLL